MIRPTPINRVLPVPEYTTADIETARNGAILAIGLYVYDEPTQQREYLTFTDWSTFLRYLAREATTNRALRVIYAHNGGKYDWVSLLEHLTGMHIYYVSAQLQGGGALCVKLRLGPKLPLIRFYDSYRLVSVSLREASQKLGLGTEKLDIGGQHPEDLYRDNPAQFHAYLQADCVSLAAVLHNLHETINSIHPIRRLGLTIAATALRLFRTGYLDRYIMTPTQPNERLIARRAYTGGRTEAIVTGYHPQVFGYDVNSLYPSVMATTAVPTSYVGYWTKRYDGKPGLYDVSYSQPISDLHPLLRPEGSSDFAYSGSGVYTHLDLDALVATGGDFSLKRGRVFVHTAVIFSKYVIALYAARSIAKQNGDSAMDITCKLLLNSLYGKFGETGTRSELRLMPGMERLEMMHAGHKVTDFGDYCAVEHVEPVQHEFTAIAAYITSAARLHLYHLLCMAGDTAVYCDTDSVYATTPMPDSMIGDGLGMLKLEYAGAMAVWGKKAYAKLLKDRVEARVKGIPRASLAHLNLADIASLVAGGSYVASYTSPATLFEVMQHDKTANVWYQRTRQSRLLSLGRRGHSAIEPPLL